MPVIDGKNKAGRPRQKPLEPLPETPASGMKLCRCVRRRQYMGRVIEEDAILALPDPLPKGMEEYFEPIRAGGKADAGREANA